MKKEDLSLLNIGNKWTVETVTSFAVADEDRPHFNFEQLKQKCSTNEKTLIIVDDYEWFAFDQLFSIDSLTGV